ncbi:MAG TPA: sulfite oxidase [Herpetosiphonaceae bacterium]|nr:sulfite oxidase [Herpetosiphonaceae bacterium]
MVPSQLEKLGDRGAVSEREVFTPGTGRPSREIITEEPYNAEAPLHALQLAQTPARHFFVRSHFDVPVRPHQDWRIRVDGVVDRPFELSIDELRALPARALGMTLECAGNDRLGFAPLPPGEPWGLGGVSTGRWRGVALCHILAHAGLSPRTVDLVFEGADRGRLGKHAGSTPFARSLPLATAMDPDTLLAYELNGEPLHLEHGAPVRLLVPDWYGMASVKWLVRITALEQPFEGPFQTERYVLERRGASEVEPLRRIRVKSRITTPANRERLGLGRHRIAGLAWSGHGAITRVEVSTDDGGDWHAARLVGRRDDHAWQPWEYEWQATRPERHVLRVRAFDEQGNTQPDLPEWNRHGYANNAIQAVVVEVEE